jgi:hypothetical protein
VQKTDVYNLTILAGNRYLRVEVQVKCIVLCVIGLILEIVISDLEISVQVLAQNANVSCTSI